MFGMNYQDLHVGYPLIWEIYQSQRKIDYLVLPKECLIY